MIHKFVSPNLKHNNGKIYFLNKNELKNKDWKYVNENYYYDINEARVNFDDCNIKLIVNNYNDDILIECYFKNDIQIDKIKDKLSKINNSICYLEDCGECYNFTV